MEETRNAIAIVLQNSPFKERDSLVSLYSKELGRLNLIVRGTKTPKSKMRGHIEPLTFIKIMIVKGKNWDYLGSVVTERAFLRIREDYDRTFVALKVIKIYLEFTKEGEAQEDIFDLLFLFLDFLDKKTSVNYDLLYSFFVLKFLCLAGFMPELDVYLDTNKKIVEKKHCFDLTAGGLVERKHSKYCFNISVDAIKVLRLVIKNDFNKLFKIKINDDLLKEINKIVNLFFDYNMKY